MLDDGTSSSCRSDSPPPLDLGNGKKRPRQRAASASDPDSDVPIVVTMQQAPAPARAPSRAPTTATTAGASDAVAAVGQILGSAIASGRTSSIIFPAYGPASGTSPTSSSSPTRSRGADRLGPAPSSLSPTTSSAVLIGGTTPRTMEAIARRLFLDRSPVGIASAGRQYVADVDNLERYLPTLGVDLSCTPAAASDDSDAWEEMEAVAQRLFVVRAAPQNDGKLARLEANLDAVKRLWPRLAISREVVKRRAGL